MLTSRALALKQENLRFEHRINVEAKPHPWLLGLPTLLRLLKGVEEDKGRIS